MTDQLPNAKAASLTPSELREVFGSNLRKLSQASVSISQLCRDLGINRTQFNRYLSGESFPRPDVLHRICDFFGVDARILLEPVETLATGKQASTLFGHEELASFLGNSALQPDEHTFPSGFYRFSRPSFMEEGRFFQGLVSVYRRDGLTFMRGHEAKDAMRQQGLPCDPKTREFRGFVMQQMGGIATLISRKNTQTTSFNFLARIPAFESNYWLGFTVRTVPEGEAGRRVARQVYQYLGRETGPVLEAARASGICNVEDLPPFHRAQLRLSTPVT